LHGGSSNFFGTVPPPNARESRTVGSPVGRRWSLAVTLSSPHNRDGGQFASRITVAIVSDRGMRKTTYAA